MKSLLGTATNAAYVLVVQVLALVTLAPADFGSFSIQYLLFAFASSLSLSLISEAWLRVDLKGGGRGDWAEYSSATLYLSLAAGVATVVISLLVEPLRPIAWIGAVAVATSTYRASARYYAVRMQEHRNILSGDAVGLVVSLAVWGAGLATGNHGLVMMTLAWAAGALASALLSKWPRLRAPRSLGEWGRKHSAQIRPLLRDSLLMDAGSIGTPYLLAPVLGLANFGVYRAISNVAAPVRLVLNPIRPQLAAAPIHRQRSAGRVSAVVAASVLFGVAAWVVLLLVGVLDLQLGSLTEIVVFAVPAAVFVAANFLGHYFYIVARAHLDGRQLLVGRVAQTLLAIVVPIVGVILWGLPGAIWGYAGCTAASSLVWLGLIVRPARGSAAR